MVSLHLQHATQSTGSSRNLKVVGPQSEAHLVIAYVPLPLSLLLRDRRELFGNGMRTPAQPPSPPSNPLVPVSSNQGDTENGCEQGVRASGGGQPCLWFSQGCSIGCKECTGIGSHTDVSLCNSTMKVDISLFETFPSYISPLGRACAAFDAHMSVIVRGALCYPLLCRHMKGNASKVRMDNEQRCG